jgi:hypothetical protein
MNYGQPLLTTLRYASIRLPAICRRLRILHECTLTTPKSLDKFLTKATGYQQEISDRLEDCLLRNKGTHGMTDEMVTECCTIASDISWTLFEELKSLVAYVQKKMVAHYCAFVIIDDVFDDFEDTVRRLNEIATWQIDV